MVFWPLVYLSVPILNVIARRDIQSTGSDDLSPTGLYTVWIAIALIMIMSRIGCLAYSSVISSLSYILFFMQLVLVSVWFWSDKMYPPLMYLGRPMQSSFGECAFLGHWPQRLSGMNFQTSSTVKSDMLCFFLVPFLPFPLTKTSWAVSSGWLSWSLLQSSVVWSHSVYPIQMDIPMMKAMPQTGVLEKSRSSSSDRRRLRKSGFNEP